VSARSALPWGELFQLHVVKKVGKVLNRRWNLGLGFADGPTGTVRPPRTNLHARSRGLCRVIQDRETGERACQRSGRELLQRLRAESGRGHARPRAIVTTCHAGLQELAAPIVIDDQIVGALVCGGFLGEDDEVDARAAIDRRVEPLALSAADYAEARVELSRLGAREIEFVVELVEEAAGEIADYLTGWFRRQQAHSDLESEYATRYSYDAIIGRSQPMQELYHLLDRVVESDSTVLVQGDNGTGKELVARAIHYNSARKNRRFVVQNCSAFNDNLLDSELFGHKRGAFTGAVSDKQGLFEVADRGTFFLDEIGDMSPSLQVEVLRVLQEGTFTPVGDTEEKKVDVRVIAATNRDLRGMVERGEFREDLYYRINVINLIIPPLRERREDVDLLIDHFLKRHAKAGRKVKRLSDDCRGRMLGYAWPGNVRELENEIERLVVLSGDDSMIAEDLLSPRIRQHEATTVSIRIEEEESSLPEAVKSLERRMIRAALERNDWNKTRAAAELRISRRNLIRLVQKYELEGRA
jgi:two-component system, NtrC family, response regulator HupR/HoxA